MNQTIPDEKTPSRNNINTKESNPILAVIDKVPSPK
jgi:hypothetical protein